MILIYSKYIMTYQLTIFTMYGVLNGTYETLRY